MMKDRFEVKQKYKNKPVRVVDTVTTVEYPMRNINDAYKICALLNELQSDVIECIDAYIDIEVKLYNLSRFAVERRDNINFRAFDKYCNLR